MSTRVETWGNLALFSRPEMKTERVSYDVMTPSAARGILDAIMWHPGMVWRVKRIYVRSPIEFMNVRRNEVKSTINLRSVKPVMERGSGELWLAASTDIQQRAALVLKNVHYVIEAEFDMTDRAAPSDNPGKFQEMAKRRIRKGQCYHEPYFGCREFPVHFGPCEAIPPCPDSLKGERDLGYMLYDMDFSDPENIRPLFFRAVLRDGVLEVPDRNSPEVIG